MRLHRPLECLQLRLQLSVLAFECHDAAPLLHHILRQLAQREPNPVTFDLFHRAEPCIARAPRQGGQPPVARRLSPQLVGETALLLVLAAVRPPAYLLMAVHDRGLARTSPGRGDARRPRRCQVVLCRLCSEQTPTTGRVLMASVSYQT